MPNYQNSKIYKITCNDTNNVYYGSTTTRLSQRKSVHKNNTIKTSASPIIEKGNWILELIEDYPCNNLHELLHRERYYIDNNNCVNKCRPISTKEEKLENDRNRAQINRENNKDDVNDYQKNYYKEKGSLKYICICGANVTHCKKSRHEQTNKHKLACVPE